MTTSTLARHASAGLALLLVVACGEDRVDVGSEGNAINTDVCFGTSCNSVISTPLDGIDPGACSTEYSGTYASTFAIGPQFNEAIVGAGDGSGWALSSRFTDDDRQLYSLHRFDADGAPLAQYDNWLDLDGNVVTFVALSAGVNGGVVALVSTSYSPDADSEVQRSARIHQLDGSARPVGPEISLTRLGMGNVKVGAEGTITLGGAGEDGRSSRLLRVTSEGEPRFIRSDVPGGSLAASLVLLPGGGSMILSSRSATTAGITTFDEKGRQVRDWLLPTPAQQLVVTPGGNVVVARDTDALDTILTSYSSSGEPLFAWKLPEANGTDLLVDAATGAVLLHTMRGLVVVPEDGADCRLYFGQTAASFRAGTLTFSDGWTLTREGLPEE